MFDQQNALNDIIPNNAELWTKDLKQQELDDNAYLNEVMQQISLMSMEQLDSIKFYAGQSNLDSFEYGAIYVDKTEQILNALGNKWLFLARPRRMGKSLTLSTVSFMSTEWYQRSIYPEHQLCPVLQNTFFAKKYSDGDTDLNPILGAPYNITLNFKDIRVNPELIDKAKAMDLLKHQPLQQQLKQGLSDNFALKKICELLMQECSNNPNLQSASDFYWAHQERLTKYLSNDKLLKFIVDLDQDQANSNCPLIDIVKAKVADISSKVMYFNEQLSVLASQIQELSEYQSDTRVSDFVGKSNEDLGQFRKNILVNLCFQMSRAVRANDRIISDLKNEILTNSPEYQQGLDLIEQQMKRNEDLQKRLDNMSQEIEANSKWDTVRFTGTVRSLTSLFKSGDLALFIDEYDSCLIDSLAYSDVAEYVRSVMEEFYASIKDMDRNYVRVVFVTGVTAYAKISLFSGANNINDISYDPNFNDIVGFTEHEIKRNFAHILCKHAILNNCSPQEIIDNLALHYDGYHFALPCVDVLVQPIFNPLAVIKTLRSSPIRYLDYWSSTGASLSKTVLGFFTQISSDDLTQTINQALNGGVELTISKSSADIFSKVSFKEVQTNATFFMYQAGYLTIDFNKSLHKQYSGISKLSNDSQTIVVLTPPNQEIRDFLENELTILVRDYKNWRFGEKVDSLISDEARKNLNIPDLGRLTLILKPFADYELSSCEYSFNQMLGQYAVDINSKTVWENFLRNILFTCIKENINASGNHELLHAETEVPVNAGRIDLIVTNERDKIKFVFEFKRVDEPDPNVVLINKALTCATNQINSHNYTNHVGYTVIAIAGAFFRNIEKFSPNQYQVGYHICLQEVKKVYN